MENEIQNLIPIFTSYTSLLQLNLVGNPIILNSHFNKNRKGTSFVHLFIHLSIMEGSKQSSSFRTSSFSSS